MKRLMPVVSPLWRKVAITIAGSFIILLGIILLPLPGPGWLVIAGGLAILATEYHWAHRILVQVRERLERIKAAALARRK